MSDPRRQPLEDLLARHVGASPRERESLQRFRSLLAALRRPFDEEADPTHVTASSIVLDGDGHTALHLHKRLGLWLQPGGHVDEDEWPADAALREAEEELGIPVNHPVEGPLMVHVDVHDGGRGHLHLDLRYLLLATTGAAFAPAQGESQDVRWVPVTEIDDWGDASVADAVRAAVTSAPGGPR